MSACALPQPTSSTRRIALVTGGNKGIGKEIARLLVTTPGTMTVIASRDLALGEAAALELRSQASPGSEVACVRLDLNDETSVLAAADIVEKEFGGLDVLVNNAAVCFNDPTLYGAVAFTPFEEQAGITVNTNYFGTRAVTNAFLPLLEKAESPRIINVASAAGRLSILRSQERMEQFTSKSLKISELDSLMKEFVSDAEAGVHANRGWPNTAYGVSKLGLIAYTRILSRNFPRIMVNSVDPGYCRTEQNNNQGNVDPMRGARTPFILATMETRDKAKKGVETDARDQFVTGKHLYEERVISWSYQ